MKVITRFAPSPTGFLHIGGARTALFNYLFSKHHGGKFLLRIEDTDQKRSSKAAIDAIINGLTWLGINWNDNIVMQSQNLKTHQQAALELLKKGIAYYCYCQPQRSKNEEASKEVCNCANLKQAPSNESTPAIRLKVSNEGVSTIEDLVMGKVTTPKKDIADFIILRRDGTPTYLLASAVDDINMNITHVIRGNDHLSNTFKQKEIFEGLSKELPTFAHIPLIHGEDGSKLSKRHGALGVEEYQKMGYINTAVNNYLLKLSWSFNNQDIISLEEAIKNFNIKDVQKSPARFDFNKLDSINSYYIKNTPLNELLTLLQPFIKEVIASKQVLENYQDNLSKLLPFLQTRCKTLKAMAAAALFIMVKNMGFTPAAKEVLQTNIALLKEQELLLKQTVDFSRDNLHQVIKSHADKQGLKLGNAATALRAALCYDIASPASVFDIMAILGQEESLARIKAAIQTTI